MTGKYQTFSKRLRKFSTSIPWMIFAFGLGILNVIAAQGFDLNLILGFILIAAGIQSVFWRIKQRRKPN